MGSKNWLLKAAQQQRFEEQYDALDDASPVCRNCGHPMPPKTWNDECMKCRAERWRKLREQRQNKRAERLLGKAQP
jgi:Zn finger protein HypA/HybF involved in hydrogenase expression